MKRKTFIYLIYTLPILLVAYLFWQNTKPNLEIEYKFNGKSAMFGELVPFSRVGDIEEDGFGKYRNINEEPVYFDVRLPRGFNSVIVEVGYSDLEADIFEIGISRDEARKNFNLVASENKILDKLEWNKIERDDMVLYQRQNRYKTIEEFFEKPPNYFETLIYRTEINPELGDYWTEGETFFDFPIKEKIKFAFYHSGGKIDLEFQDVKITLFKNGKILDFNSGDEFDKGVYIMEIKGDENFVLENGLCIDSPYVAILDNIKIGELKSPKTIYMAGARLFARTENAEALQKIWIGSREEIELNEPFVRHMKVFNNLNLRSIYISKGNIELSGNLFFAKNYNFFYPRYETLYPDVDLNSINYILAKYKPSEGEGVLKSAKAKFNIKNTPMPYSKLRFLLSFPNTAEGNLMKIRNIKLKFEGEKISFVEIFDKIFRKIYAKFSILQNT